ncbi:PAAR domain-containing protein [Paraburkholderia sp.]|uniref:PAAR domain-containing protein n=1 Tax=Paraburkholderia sp. TaxID=1926495 RepID=UPI003D700211
MQRNFLRIGDRSSAGGVVVNGIEKTYCYDRELTYVGATVTCPVCKTTGRIAARGPRWPGTMMDKVPAFEGDVCECACPTPPTMIASQDTMFEKYESHELAGLGFSENGGPLEIASLMPEPSSTLCLSCLIAAARNGAAMIARG